MATKLYNEMGQWHQELLDASARLCSSASCGKSGTPQTKCACGSFYGVPPNRHPDVLALPIKIPDPSEAIAFKMRPEQLAEKARLKALEDEAEAKRVADLAARDAAIAAAQAEAEKPVSKIAPPPDDVPAGIPPDVTDSKVS